MNPEAKAWRVLLIEDNIDDRIEIKSLLLRGSDRRYEFLEMTTGAEGVRLCREEKPDCVILDYDLPDMTAVEILSLLPRLGDDPTQVLGVPVVILTGSMDLKLSRAVIRAGAHDFVSKDWMTPDSLTRALENAAERLEMATELRRASQALADREEFNRSLMDGSADCVKVLDLEGRLLHMNQPGLHQMEIDDFTPLCGREWRSVWPAESTEVIETAQASARSGQVSSFQAFCPTAKGTPKWWEVTVSPVRSGIGDRIVRLLSVSRDITGAKKLEAEREQILNAERWARSESERVARAKDEFLATLSHELRTPLNAIVGWAEILKRSADNAALVREGIEVIARNAQAQSQLIADLLDMNRILTGKLKLEVSPTAPNFVAAAAADTVRPSAEAKRLRLELQLGQGLPQVHADPGRLQQVLWNLLANAVKFTPAGGAVTLSTSTADGMVRFVVTDTGKGLDPTFMPFLFDRFSQADASAARQHGGLGLGLSIVKQLVDLHGGTVAAESEGPGHGARFIVTLPATQQAPEVAFAEALSPAATLEPAAFPVSEGTAADLSGLRILVVDDQADALEMARRLLAECGAAVETASSAEAALDRLERQLPDVLVSDIGMPGMDGYSLIRDVRQRWQPSELPAAALTAFARPEDRDRAFSAGYQAHLSKPLRPQDLIATVAALAKR